MRIKAKQPTNVCTPECAQAPHSQIQVLLHGKILADDDHRGISASPALHRHLELPGHGRQAFLHALPGAPLCLGHGHPDIAACLLLGENDVPIGPIREPRPWNIFWRTWLQHSEPQELVAFILGVRSQVGAHLHDHATDPCARELHRGDVRGAWLPVLGADGCLKLHLGGTVGGLRDAKQSELAAVVDVEMLALKIDQVRVTLGRHRRGRGRQRRGWGSNAAPAVSEAAA
mmetsp:Transcript_19619/g.52064  ORF Transcript_19619/g.52064 Transcript_19619/m.52064 type:complete len:230 (+) Transcript_19619:433-1122(+)